jgi:hypothetical protein
MKLFLLALGAAAWAQPAPSGWFPLGEGSTVRAEGTATAFDYTLAPRRMGILAMHAPAELTRAGRIRFSVKADHATAMAALLTEKKPGGGNYMAWFWAPANEWQSVDLTPADFTVTDGPGDPVDADGKLDLDAVETIGILDLAQFFGTLKATASVPVHIDDTQGQHTFLVDHFDLAPEAARGSALERGFLDWVSPGGMNLKLDDAGSPLAGRAAARDRAPARISFDIASEHEVTLVLSLEMKKAGGGEGPRFTLPIYPPGGREVFHVDVKLEDFKGPGTFDPKQWRTTAIVDVTNADEANTIWIANMKTLE